MNASKLIITPETRAKLNNPVLTPIKKRQLREQLIIEHIRNSVGGEATKQELIVAGGFKSDAKSNDYARGMSLIKSMVRRGIISHNRTNAFKKIWTVTVDVKTKERVPHIPLHIPKDLTAIKEEPQDIDRAKLVDLAKEFAWEHNSDSLRDFIAHIEKSIK